MHNLWNPRPSKKSVISENIIIIFYFNSHLPLRGTPLLKWQQEPTLPAGLAGAQWNPRGPPRRPPPPLSRKSPPLTNHCRYRRHSTSNSTLHSWKRPSPNWDMTRMEKYLPHFWSDQKPTRQYQVNIGSHLYKLIYQVHSGAKCLSRVKNSWKVG